MADIQTPGVLVQTLPQSSPQAAPPWGHRNVQPGSGLGSGGVVPGLRVMAGQRFGRVKRNKSGFDSNIPIHTTVKASEWKYKHYEQRQGPGDVLFVGDPEHRTQREQCDTLNYAQINSLLRDYFNSAVDSSKDRPGGLISEFERQTKKADPEMVKLFANLAREGEDIFDDTMFREKAHNNRRQTAVYGLSRRMINERFRMLGVYVSDSGRGPQFDRVLGHRTITVATGGPTRMQECKNFWGSIELGEYVGFILKRRLDLAASTPDRLVYKEFQLVPWHSYWSSPTWYDRFYYDDAGRVQLGTYIPVGTVNQRPLDVSDAELISQAAGLTADEAMVVDVMLETVQLNVGTRQRFLDLC